MEATGSTRSKHLLKCVFLLLKVSFLMLFIFRLNLVIPGEAPRKVSKIKNTKSCQTSKGWIIPVSPWNPSQKETKTNLLCGSLYQVAQQIGRRKMLDSVKAIWSHYLRYYCFLLLLLLLLAPPSGALVVSQFQDPVQSIHPSHPTFRFGCSNLP